MDEAKTRQIFREEIEKYMGQKQFNANKIPKHKHDGIDTLQVNENDLVPANNFTASLVMGSAGNEVFTISKIPKLSLLTFYGVATNGAYGGGPYNEKAVIVGEARVGKLYDINTVIGTDYHTDGVPILDNYYQICSSTYTNVVTAANQFVSASKTGFVYVWDGSNVVAQASITGITEQSLEITVTVLSSWYIQGFLFMS